MNNVLNYLKLTNLKHKEQPPIVTQIVKSLPLLILSAFVLIEILYGALLFSGVDFGGDPLVRFYDLGLSNSPTPSEIYTTDNHAQSVIWFTAPLAALTYANRQDPAKLSRLLSYVGLIIVTMSGLILGMGQLGPNAGKLVPSEYSFSVCLNVALLVAVGIATRAVPAAAAIGDPMKPSTPAHKAALFHGIVNAVFFYKLVLGDRADFHADFSGDRTSGLAWITAALLFTMLVGRFTLTYGTETDAVAYCKGALAVVALNELYQTFWLKDRFHAASAFARFGARFIHCVVAAVMVWGIRSAEKLTSEGEQKKERPPIGINPAVPIVVFVLNQLYWSIRLLSGASGIYAVDLSSGERFQSQLQGLSITWGVVPLLAAALASRKDPFALSRLCLPIQLVSLASVGILLSLAGHSNGGQIKDGNFGPSVAINLLVFGLATTGSHYLPASTVGGDSSTLSRPKVALLFIVGLNVFYFLDLSFGDGSKFNSSLVTLTSFDRVGATSWIALNILSVVHVLLSVVRNCSNSTARFVCSTFVAVVFYTEAFNRTVGEGYIPSFTKIEVGAVHAAMAGALIWGAKEGRGKKPDGRHQMKVEKAD